MKDLFHTYEKEIRNHTFNEIIIEHVWGSAIPWAITKNDLDIQVRIEKERYSEVIEALRALYETKRTELRTPEFAIFHDMNNDVEVDICVTVIDCPYDLFSRTRDAIIENPELLDEYNAIKIKHNVILDPIPYRSERYQHYSNDKKAFWKKIAKTYLQMEYS